MHMHNRAECGYTSRSGNENIIIIRIATNIIAGKIEARHRPAVADDISNGFWAYPNIRRM
jgi:hypothetical protein